MSIKTLGDLIQVKRYEKRLTIKQLARKMGIATASVRAWECDTGHPNEQQTMQLLTILGASLSVGQAIAPIGCANVG